MDIIINNENCKSKCSIKRRSSSINSNNVFIISYEYISESCNLFFSLDFYYNEYNKENEKSKIIQFLIDIFFDIEQIKNGEFDISIIDDDENGFNHEA